MPTARKVFIKMDILRTQQIIINLLSNAIKFSPKGSFVFIRADVQWFSENRCIAKVSVLDQGVGISAEDQQRLFTPFFRSSDPLNR